MKCPSCGSLKDTVIDSRPAAEGKQTRRRRECTSCHTRFTTWEYVEGAQLTVLKANGERELFSRAKLRRGLEQALHKRGKQPEQVEELLDHIERGCQGPAAASGEIPSARLGEIVLEALLHFDQVAYIRFASVYRRFSDAEGFLTELEKLRRSRED